MPPLKIGLGKFNAKPISFLLSNYTHNKTDYINCLSFVKLTQHIFGGVGFGRFYVKSFNLLNNDNLVFMSEGEAFEPRTILAAFILS